MTKCHFKKGDFMKKQLTVALGLAVLATPAFATKARLQALGEDSYGSAYISDNRNVWLNAAQIHNHKDLVTYELGGNAAADSAATSRGEGGLYRTTGNHVYGVHFGGASTTSNNLRTGAGLVGADEKNNIDLFFGGDAGVKWGAAVGYAKTSDESSPLTSEAVKARLGAIMGDTQAYANVDVANMAKDTAGVKYEGKMGYQLGAIQAWQGNTVFVDWSNYSGQQVGATKKDLSTDTLTLGLGRVHKLNDKTNMFARASYSMSKAENETKTNTASCTGLNCKDYESTQVPVVVGVETEASSWLTLRASIAQVVWGTEDSKNAERTINQTTVNAGASLKFGELTVDGVVGNSTTAGVAGENTGSGNGTLRTDTLMSRVSMTYRF
jgi:hypothetical protein